MDMRWWHNTVCWGSLIWAFALHGQTGPAGQSTRAAQIREAARPGQQGQRRSQQPIVTTETGAVLGIDGFSTQVFLGVPYAAPPVGALRWKAPSAAAPWSGVRPATQKAQACAAPLSGDGPRSANEDCLYLNVYRPTGVQAGAKLPVMVFLHGGGNVWGSPNIYDGVRMAEVGHAVVVLPAFRLNALGLLALPAMGGDAGTFMLQDQLAALRWVQRNIGAFGGDPEHVTLSGQSAGAGDACALIASPAAAGLFREAIVQSGSCANGPSLAEAEQAGEAFAKKLGCAGADAVACLQGKPVDELVDAWNRPPSGRGEAPYGGPLLPHGVADAVAAGSANRVPVLIGFAQDELWPFQHGLYPLSEAGYQQQLTQAFGARTPSVAELYPEAAYPHREYALGAALGDAEFICPALESAAALAKWSRVSVYEFADRTVPPFKSLGLPSPRPPGYNPGAFHTSELQYLYNYQAAEGPLNETQRRLGDKLIALWVGFNHVQPDPWPVYTAASRIVTRLGPDGVTLEPSETVYDTHHCEFWKQK